MKLSIGQNGNFEEDLLRHSQPMEADKNADDVIVTSNTEDERPCCGILN